MKKSIYWLLSLMLVISMLLAACGGAEEEPTTPPETAAEEPPEEPTEEPEPEPAEPEKTVLKVWSFTNELRTKVILFEAKHPEVDIEFTMIPMTDGEFQTKVKAAARTADAPDAARR